MTKAKINECVFCRRVSVVSVHFQTYVCDDCYEKQQAEKKILMEAEAHSYQLDE